MLDKIIKELEAKIAECDIILLNSEDMTVFYIHGSMKQGYQEAIQIIKQHEPQHPTITDSEIELQAKEFRKANLLSVSFTPDVHSFITGAKAVLSMMPQSEGWVKVEDVPTDRVLEVLLFNANQAPHLQHIIKGTWFLESKSFKHSQLYFYEPSHWMPLPKHP